MQSRTKQALHLRYLSHEVVNERLRVRVQMVETRPGRPDVLVGLPMVVALDDRVWLDPEVCDLGNSRWYEEEKRQVVVAAHEARLLQPSLFDGEPY